MAFTVLLPESQRFESPSWKPDDSTRHLIELRRFAELRHSQANLWRYPPGAFGRRHKEPVQEEVFCVLEGTLTMLLGEPPELHRCPPRSVVIVEPGTPLQLRNDTASDVIFFAYGAPHQPADYKAEILGDP